MLWLPIIVLLWLFISWVDDGSWEVEDKELDSRAYYAIGELDSDDFRGT